MMQKPVMLSLRGRQAYLDQEPDEIELITEGTIEFSNGGWNVQYEETGLTGMDGVTTTFRVEPDKIILTRTGKLQSEMIFEMGVKHESLYQMDFGALLISVCATRIIVQLDDNGGFIDLIYNIDIENSAAGTVDYHLQITPK